MQKGNKRLRIFAGPNGSGKSTLFSAFKQNYNPGYFINADELEKELNLFSQINLTDIGVKSSTKELNIFSKLKVAKTLLKKAQLKIQIVLIFLIIQGRK